MENSNEPVWPPCFFKKHTSVLQPEDTHGWILSTPVNTLHRVTAQQALPFMFPITKLITSFLHDCVTYKDIMDLLEGEELCLWSRVTEELVFV